MKRFLQIFSLVLFASMAYSQSDRLVFLEEFTQASCPPCEATTPQLNSAVAANAEKIVQLRYQVWFPGYDPMYLDNEQEVRDRATYYAITGVPDLYLDGEAVVGNNQTIIPQSAIDNSYAISAPILVELSHTISQDLKNADITVKITNEGTTDYKLNSDKLRVVFVEEDITYPSAPGSTSIRVYEAVMKKFITGTAGIDVPTIAAGASWEQTWTAEALPDVVYNFSKLAVVAFVQNDDDKNVLNSAYSDPQPIAAFADLSVSSITTIPADFCEYDFTPRARVRNDGNITISTFSVLMYINGELVVTKEVTTPIEAGKSQNVVLEQTRTLNPGNSSIVFVVSPTSAEDLSVLNNFSPSVEVGKIADVTESFINDFEASDIGVYSDNSIVKTPNVQLNFSVASKDIFGTAGSLGAYGDSEKSLFVNFYDWNNASVEATGYLIVADKFEARKGDVLSFDWAYTTYTTGGVTSNDKLQIQISTDCGKTFTDVFSKSGVDLRTGDETPDGSRFIPNASQWKSTEIDISAFEGQTINVRLFATSEYGNQLFIDNINITSNPLDVNDLSEGESLDIMPNPATANTTFEFNLASATEVSYAVTDVMGKLVENKSLGSTSGKFNHTFNVSDYKSGLYFVNFQLGDRNVIKRLMVVH